MAQPARKTEVEFPMEAQLSRLEERTEHIQSDVAEIKGDIRRLDAKLDAVRVSFDGKVDAVKASLEGKVASLEGKLDAVKASLEAKVDDVKTSVTTLMEKVSSIQVSMIKWMVGTIIAAITLAFAVAKFLLWPSAQTLIGGGT